MLNNPLILVAEHEVPLAAVLRSNLENQGFQVEDAAEGERALACIAKTTPDLVVVDWTLPSMFGMNVCRQIRRVAFGVPIIVLGAGSGDQDIVDALDAGADAYVPKPFSTDILLARVGTLLRRVGMLMPKRLTVFLDLTMDLAAHSVQRSDRRIHLGPTEFRLLEILLEDPHRVFSREELRNALWGSDPCVQPRTVDTCISRLRRSINARGEQSLIHAVRNTGYVLHVGSVHRVQAPPFSQLDG